VKEEERSDNQKAGLIVESLDIFEGGKQTKDFHGMFNHEYFVKWMATLLATLKERKIENAIIVMDNAKYHKKLPNNIPRKNSRKAVLHAACDEYSIPFTNDETKAELWEKLKKHIQENVSPVIVEMAQSEGHEVLFTPPHYSDLQPIETVWAVVKGEVGRQYTAATTLKDVYNRLTLAFENLTTQVVRGCINKANDNLRKLYSDIVSLEDYEDGESSDDENDDKTKNSEISSICDDFDSDSDNDSV
jgi:hypothetical protein